jgi:hypothetical protein
MSASSDPRNSSAFARAPWRRAGFGAWAELVLAALAIVGCSDDGSSDGGHLLAAVDADDAEQVCGTLGRVAVQETEAQGSGELTAVVEAYRELASIAAEFGADQFSAQATNAADALEAALDDSDALIVEGLRRDLARAHLDLACAEAGYPTRGS